MSVYDVARLGEQFDVVLFMGVLYHLRHPLLALDLIREHVAKDLLVFQSLQRGSDEVYPVAADYDFSETAHFDEPGYPKLHLVEHEYARDWTNWWIPNAACSAAMLRIAGFEILEHPEADVFLCRACEPPKGAGAVYPARPEAAARTAADRDPRGRARAMIEAVKIWNEPNNKSHWDPLLDPEWDRFARDGDPRRPGDRGREPRPHARARRDVADRSALHPPADRQGVLDAVDVVAVHGFPLDWNLWQIDEWPDKLDEIRTVTRQAGLGDRGRRLVVRRRGGAGLGREAHRRAARRARAAHPLVQPLRPAQDLGGHHAPQGGGGLVLLPAFPHGPAARGRHAQAGAGGLRRLRGRHGPVPVVPFRGPPARRGGRLDEAARRAAPAHGAVLGGQLPARMRSPGSTGRWRRWPTSTSP